MQSELSLTTCSIYQTPSSVIVLVMFDTYQITFKIINNKDRVPLLFKIINNTDTIKRQKKRPEATRYAASIFHEYCIVRKGYHNAYGLDTLQGSSTGELLTSFYAEARIERGKYSVYQYEPSRVFIGEEIGCPPNSLPSLLHWTKIKILYLYLS